MALLQEQEYIYTIEDIYALPDGTRAELIDNQIYYMAPPTPKHQRILSFLHIRIGKYIEDKNGQCEIFPAPFAVFLNENDVKYVEPDISVICDPNKVNDKGCVGSPDLIIEIVSPSSKRMDYYTKLFKYRSANVKEYWIVDPLKGQITVHFFEDSDSPYTYTFKDKVGVNIYDNLVINFNELNI